MAYGSAQRMLRYCTEPWKHQIEALEFLYPRDFGALYTDMGSGKTKIMIDLIVNRGFKKTLIVAPKKVCRVWKPQFTIHAPNEPITVLDVSNIAGREKAGAIKEAVLESKLGQLVIVVNYDSVWREPFRSFLIKLGLDAIICDESHRIKTPSSKCSKALQFLGRRVKNRFLMTGTPLAQSPLDIYAQYRFLDPSIFGTNFHNFKLRYANLITVPGGFTMIDKKDPYKNLDELREKMLSCAFQTEVEQNLPPTQDITIEFDLSKETQKHYKEIQKEGVLLLKEGYVEAGNILTVITRLQQLSSGYLPVQTEDGKKIIEIDDSRRVALKELLEDLPPEEPVVVFAKYRKDIKNIRRIVKELGRKSSEVSGERDTLHNWIAGKTTVLVVQISAGAEGIDLTRAKYCIYYTLTSSLSKYKQSRKRVHRPGQTRPVIYYTLVGKMKRGKTIDERLVESLLNNQEITDYVMDLKEI
jgi:SNF2 family DNA or RNA helicase